MGKHDIIMFAHNVFRAIVAEINTIVIVRGILSVNNDSDYRMTTQSTRSGIELQSM